MVLRRLLKAVGIAGSGADATSSAAGWGVPTGEAVEHGGCSIQATPRKEAGGWRVAGIIRPLGEAVADGEAPAEHRFVRVDLYPSQEAAADLALAKGRQIVDEQGMRLFAARPGKPA